MSVLDEILAHKRGEVEESRGRIPRASLVEAAADAPPPRGFAEALGAGDRLPIIAEVKKASPSKGLIRDDFDPVAIAKSYETGGAAALSVLTDEKFFQGSLSYLREIRAQVEIPLLRKDFIIDSYQVLEARAAGADAILLILAAIPDDAHIAQLAGEAEELGMDVLWEVHDRDELERLLPLGPRVVGINNRDLRTFDVSLETTRDLVPAIPQGVVKVSESGFCKRHELEIMLEWGVDAFLIGESLMRAPDPGVALRELIEGERGET